MIEKLFVYGTLAPGKPNEHVLGAIGGTWEVASVIGILHQEGWGAELGYPGIILEENGDEISGHLFSSNNLAEHWVELDEFEGKAYDRVITSVKLTDNRTVDAYIYALREK